MGRNSDTNKVYQGCKIVSNPR